MLLRIYLIGYMGSGKSTIAAELAERLSWDWIDTDHIIEQRTGLSISELFRRYGEDDFRSLESSALHRSATREHTIIATGGGAPCYNDNMDLMKAQGKVFYLSCTTPVLVDRLLSEADTRPLIASLSTKELPGFITDHVQERLSFYNQADHVIDADVDVSSAVTSILSQI